MAVLCCRQIVRVLGLHGPPARDLHLSICRQLQSRARVGWSDLKNQKWGASPANPSGELDLRRHLLTHSFSILTRPVVPKPHINRLRPDGFPKVTKLHCARASL